MYNLLGAYTPTGSNEFVGKLDEVAVLNIALSGAQIQSIHAATVVVGWCTTNSKLIYRGIIILSCILEPNGG